jgi:outer membrane protein assembly factor BamD
MKNLFIILIIALISVSCSPKKNEIVTKVEGDNIEEQMIAAYEAGVKALENGDIIYATKKFNESELLYPQSKWAPKASLMSAYAYWSQSYYQNSVDELNRFLNTYPKNPNLDYAYYLLGMNYFDSIIDEKKDLKPLRESKKYFEILVKKYPDTDYALDAKYKLDLIQDIYAAKELYIARHYIKKQKWIAALNRLKTIVDEYQTTIFIEEALHRLVEVNYIIGLEDEAKKYAKILGYNYQSSEWYKKSYNIFQMNDKNLLRETKFDQKKKLLDKVKSFF